MTAAGGDKLAKNIRIQRQENSVNSKKSRFDQCYLGQDSVKTLLISRYFWSYGENSVNLGDSVIC